ncbi:MAG: hypothetical protein NTW03_05675, partial [Verrucomicrobia bacterium]|nr:hypothetical protein [Verrucomicrobiota bacterium]
PGITRMAPLVCIRIHGDNILECERGLELIAEAFSATAKMVPCHPFLPVFSIVRAKDVLFQAQLLPGHGRWRADVQRLLREQGAPLREATDVLVTKIGGAKPTEEISFALEFCSALLAGNNAWQRNGRALACAVAGVPYLYFAELGGVELDANRVIKAPRFPNPIVPFSYLTAAKIFGAICLPIYAPSPSSSETIRADYRQLFGAEIGRRLIRCLLEGTPTSESEKELKTRALLVVELLAGKRSCVDTLRGQQWRDFLNLRNAQAKADWLERANVVWRRKTSGKVLVSDTFLRLVGLFENAASLSVGAMGIPLCLVPQRRCANLGREIAGLYPDSLSRAFLEWLSSTQAPLVVVWITGFKPRGDDSRPDRGLVPLARMVFGDETRILSVVSGPGKPAMWDALRRNPQQVAQENGLWEAVINLSDAVLADSKTSHQGAFAFLTHRKPLKRCPAVSFLAANVPDVFTEHDVDATLHLLFARQVHRYIFEAMCNPPGGDWSGVTLRDFRNDREYRWTSLPRVSGKNAKRPDHAVELLDALGKPTLLLIESKTGAASLEPSVGPRMRRFIDALLAISPTIFREADGSWNLFDGAATDLHPSVIAGAAFCWNSALELTEALERGALDIALAVEFRSGKEASLLHVKARSEGSFLIPLLVESAKQFGGRLEVQIH